MRVRKGVRKGWQQLGVYLASGLEAARDVLREGEGNLGLFCRGLLTFNRFGTESGVANLPTFAVPPISSLLHKSFHWHERGNVTPKMKCSEIELGSTNPLLRSSNVLDNQRNVASTRFGGFPLNPEARLKESVIRWRQRLRSLPRHCSIAVRLAGRARDNHDRILELRAV